MCVAIHLDNAPAGAEALLFVRNSLLIAHSPTLVVHQRPHLLALSYIQSPTECVSTLPHAVEMC